MSDSWLCSTCRRFHQGAPIVHVTASGRTRLTCAGCAARVERNKAKAARDTGGALRKPIKTAWRSPFVDYLIKEGR